MGKKQESIELIAPDPLLDSLKKGAGWIEKHLKLVVGGFVLALLSVLSYEFIVGSSQRDAAAVTSKLGDAVKAYEEATDPQRILTSTIATAVNADLERAREKFAAVTEDHPKHGAARLARLYEADIARRLGKNGDAEALYKTYLETSPAEDVLRFLALEGAGYAAEELGKLDEALNYFSRIGEGSTAFYKDYGLKHKARVLEKKQDVAGAKAALEAIVAIEPPSPLRSVAEERLKLLQ